MAHIPHNPSTLLAPHNHTPTLNMKSSSSLSSKQFLSKHNCHQGGQGPSLRSILVLTFITLYGLQSLLTHFSTYAPSVSRRFSPSSSSEESARSSRTSFGAPFPTATAHSGSAQRSRSRRQQTYTYSPQEQQYQQRWKQQHQQNWYNDNGYQYQYQDEQQQQENEPEEQTEFEKMFYTGPSYYDNVHDHSRKNNDYDSTSYTTPQYEPDNQDDDSFGAYDQYATKDDLPGADCKGYYCADTQTCVDQPLNCPCPHILDTKCFRSDWFVCFRGPHQC
ncbi:MAG: hypothetical protein J3R72DRAFT_450911 [Linnemannia gamsii]|nr:MAG: hypothetical protein J3R72DRAFT_450911 [Linnemannia gamsii]